MASQKYMHQAGGFTLLEMGLVLFVLVLMVGAAIPVTSGLMAEERLRRHTNDLLLYARTARRLAVAENRFYEIRFAPDEFTLEPSPASGGRPEEVVSRHVLPADTHYALQGWQKSEFSKPDDEVWVFSPGGICEPIRVHFQADNNWIEFAFNPLTARAQEERFHFQ